jgi:hypothetical protein
MLKVKWAVLQLYSRLEQVYKQYHTWQGVLDIEIYPEPKLTPSDPYEKAEDKMLSETFAKVRQFYFNEFIN